MRLKISIQRNSLPPVKTIWPLNTIQQSWTIAQLLEHINQTFPLESDHWGLEDYIVTLAGFECIHHHEISAICKDEDELVIRPLQSIEVRGRTISGRHQISDSGRHLIDGVPFGKQTLVGPVRPDVRIPPRKRRRLDAEEELAELLLLENGVADTLDSGTIAELDEDEEDDESDFMDDEENEDEIIEELDMDSSDTSDSDSSDSSDDSLESLSEDSPDEDDSDDTDTSSESEEESEASFEGVDDINPHAAATNGTLSEEHIEGEATALPATATTSDGLVNTETNEQSRGRPFEGTSITHERNERRRKKKRLDYLKKIGELPENASFAQLAQYDGTAPQENEDQKAEMARLQQELLCAIANGGIDVDDRQLLPAQSHKVNEEPPEEMSSKNPAQIENGHTSTHVEATTKVPIALTPSSVTRRAKLDLTSSQRLVFSSLGVKVPRTDADKDKTRNKLANGKASKHDLKSAITPPQQGSVEDWQSKINLTAVECADEDVVLSDPSFPFVQHWDPQYQKRGKKRKRAQAHVETYDKYNTNGGGDYLDYDGVAEDDEELDDSYWEEGALLDNDESDDQDSGAVDDDFPSLPGDIATCPVINEADAQAGDYIVWSSMAVSAATGWQPAIVTKTVQLLEKGDDGWTVRAALRDLPAKQYDKDGQRVFDKFETGEEEDEALERPMTWEEFEGGPRLLSRSA